MRSSAKDLHAALRYWLDFAKARIGEMDADELGQFEAARTVLAKAEGGAT